MARAKGKRWGGSAKGRRLKVTDEQAGMIRQMAGGGVKVAAIAKKIGTGRRK